MLKALFLDMDETLCDTVAANQQAQLKMAQQIAALYSTISNPQVIAENYVRGIYREWTGEQQHRYMPIIEQQNEGAFRVQLVIDLLAEQGIADVDESIAQQFQDQFDKDRIAAFDFYPGITEFLADARKLFTLVVITNGPEFSQIPKVERINLKAHVDHIIIGGQEPEQKPARSIFDKALALAQCEPHEAIHVGDSLATDIAGAQESGISSVWIQHQQPLDAELGIDPTHTVLHPSEIPALIEDLHQTHTNS
jgi:HAD superfamily hydrolase (TIGR01549 family)